MSHNNPSDSGCCSCCCSHRTPKTLFGLMNHMLTKHKHIGFRPAVPDWHPRYGRSRRQLKFTLKDSPNPPHRINHRVQSKSFLFACGSLKKKRDYKSFLKSTIITIKTQKREPACVILKIFLLSQMVSHPQTSLTFCPLTC